MVNRMVNHRLKMNAGTTLVELMIVVAVIFTISAGVSTVITKVMQLWQSSKVRSDIEREVRTSLEVIEKSLRGAQESTVVIDSFSSSQPPYSRISFTDINGRSISFYQLNKKLKLQTASGSSTLMTNLRNIMFTYPCTRQASDEENVIIMVSLSAEGQYFWGGNTRIYHMNLEKIRIMN